MAETRAEQQRMIERVLYGTESPEAARAIATILARHGFSILTDEGLQALYDEQCTIFNEDL